MTLAKTVELARGAMALAATGALILLVSGCGSDTTAADAPSPSTPPMPSGMSMSPGMSMSGMGGMSMGGMSMGGMSMGSGPATGAPGSLIVLGPGTLADALPLIDKAFVGANSGAAVSPNLGHSPAQVIQLQQGSPGDVFLTVGAESMDQAKSSGLLAGPITTFARNRLEIVVAAGNPHHISSLADLAASGLTIVLPDTSTPVGVYAMQSLTRAGVTVKPASLEEGSPDVVEKVATGNADAGIVFVTDVAAGGSKVSGVTIPQADQVPVEYDAAVLKSAKDPATAKRFVSFLVSSPAQQALDKLSFLAP